MTISLPLEGLKVVELGTHMAVPSATRFLADWGAEVIKVESLRGDEWRTIGNLYKTTASDEENPLFTVANANKKFIAIDLKNSHGKKIMIDLLKSADAFVTNVRLKSLEKMGLGYADVKTINQKIIYFHFTGFGYNGPDKDRPGFDMAAYWARSGAMVDYGDTGAYPIKPFGGFGDSTTGANIAAGVLAGLQGREKTGKGTFVSSSLLSSALWYNSTAVVVSQKKYGYQLPNDRNTPMNPFSHIYKCKDNEFINITTLDYDGKWVEITALLNLETYKDDDRFNTLRSAQKNITELMPILNQAFKQKTCDEWIAILKKTNIVYEKLFHFKDVANDQQAWQNNFLKEVCFENNEKAMLPTTPVHFSNYDLGAYHTTGIIGRDSQKVLADIGYGTNKYRNLLKDGVIK